MVQKITAGHVVLARTIGWAPDQAGEYVTEADVYTGFNFQPAQVSYGHISLSPDGLRIPPILTVLNEQAPLDSFALATVRAANPDLLSGHNWNIEHSIGLFVSRGKIPKFSAGQVLNPGADRDNIAARLRHHMVIVGGNWHERGRGRGKYVDSHESPVGELSGVELHANYVESIANDRIYPQWSVPLVVDIGLSLLLAYFLAQRSLWRRVKYSSLLFIGILLLSYILFTNLGVFFEATLVTGLLVFHVLVERLIAPRARQYTRN